MSNAFSYLSGVLLNEKMSVTERKIGEAKAIIKNATEKLKAREEELKSVADKKSQTAQHIERSIEHWKGQIESAENRIKDLSRGIDNFKDHDPEELEKKFTKEKEKEQHSKNFSKMSDEDLQAAAEEHQKNVDELDDEGKKNIKDDPKHLSIQKELKKRQMQKIELKKIKAKSTETDPQQKTDDPREQDPSKPTENPDLPNLPDPPANMTDGDNANGGKEEFPTDEKGWDAYKKNVEKEREEKKAKHFSNWSGDKLRPGVDPKKAEDDERAYDEANKKNINTQFAYSKWRDNFSKQKAAEDKDKIQVDKPKEEPKETPKQEIPKDVPKDEPSSNKFSKVDNDKDWERVLTGLSNKKKDADDNYKNLIDNDGDWKEDVTDEQKQNAKEQIAKVDSEMKDAEEAHALFKATQKKTLDKKTTSDKEANKQDVPKDEPTSEPKEEQPNKTEYKGEDKSHPLNFDNFEKFKQHHREKAESSEHPTEYGDAVKYIKKVNKDINDLNDEIDLNNKELNDPKIKKEDKELIKQRNKELSKEIKELHNSKKPHEKVVNKHEQELSSHFYEQHSKKKELSDKIDDVVKNYREAEANGEKEKMQKLGADFDELHGQLKKHLGEGPTISKGEESEPSADDSVESEPTPIKKKIGDWEDADIDDSKTDNVEDSEEGDSPSRALAKKTGYEENKFKKEGMPKKIAKEIAKKTQWILNRLGSGLHIQDSSISDVIKNSPSRQALVSNYEKLSEWNKQRVLKKIKKPFEDHLQDLDDSIEDAERELEKYETQTNLSLQDKEKMKVARKKLAALNNEQRSAKETYDKIIEKGETEPRKRNVVDVDVDDSETEVDNTDDSTVVPDVKSISRKDDDDSSPKSIQYLKKIASNNNSSDSEDHGEPIEGIDFKKNDAGEEESFEPGDKLQNAISAAQSEIERLDRYESSEAESIKKSLEGAIEMGEKAIKSNEGIGYALKSLKSAYTKAKTIKESFLFLKTKTKEISIICESKEVEVKFDPFKYLKESLRG